jgi:hypothetical protein
MNKKKFSAILFLITSIVLISIILYIAFYLKNKSRRDSPRPMAPWSFIDFLFNGEQVGNSTILLGLLYGTILGIIDVIGIYYVLQYLKIFMPKNELLNVGVIEIYSSIMAVIVGTFIQHTIKLLIPPKKPIPILIDAVGIVIGCLGTSIAMTFKY